MITKLANLMLVLILFVSGISAQAQTNTESTEAPAEVESSFTCLAEVTDEGFQTARPDFESDENALDFIYTARDIDPLSEITEQFWFAKYGIGAKYFVMFGNSTDLNIRHGITWQATRASEYERFYIHVNVNGFVRGGWFADLVTECGQEVVVVAINWEPVSEEETIMVDIELPTTYFSIEVQN